MDVSIRYLDLDTISWFLYESETHFLKWSQGVKKDNNKNSFGICIQYIDCYVDDLGEVDDLLFVEKKMPKTDTLDALDNAMTTILTTNNL